MKSLFKKKHLILGFWVFVFSTLVIGKTSTNLCELKRVSKNVIVVQGQDNMQNNIIAVKTSKGIVVIDSSISPVIAAEASEIIEHEFSGLTVKYLLNTHGHGDHTYGNQVFKDSIIIGHENCINTMKKRESSRLKILQKYKNVVQMFSKKLITLDENSEQAILLKKKIKGFEVFIKGHENNFILTLPTITFKDRLTFSLGETTFNLLYFGKAHSDSDILIHCPEEHLLMTGDLFTEGYSLYINSDKVPYLEKWKSLIENILSNNVDLEYIIPGHNKFLTKNVLNDQLKYIKEKISFFNGKESAFNEFKKTYSNQSMSKAVKQLKFLKKNKDKYYFIHDEVDSFGFSLMQKGELEDAVLLFEALGNLFPESYLAFDSLGEVYLAKGDSEKAVKNFKKSLLLNPENENAVMKLNQLQSK